MISKKVLYSEQLLQLVLALSLLQVDPINYLEWGVSRIHTSGIGPWQLEVAHTPFSEYPYMNRKTYVPLIEDLARYDRVHRNNDVQAYLLNFDDAQPFAASNNNNNSSTNVNSTLSNTAENERNSGDSASAAALNLVNLIQERGGHVDDIFLQSDLFSHATNTETSIIDQNLADLSDYDDHQLPRFLAVPTKTEVSDPWDEFVGLRDGSAEEERERSPSRRLDVRELSLNATRAPPSLVRTAIIDWNDYLPFVNDSSVEVVVKKEPKENEQEEDNRFKDVIVKKEETDDVGEQEDNSEVTSNVELTVEEMDLIEVLWKQDVDLGYNPIMPSLNPAQQQKEVENAKDEIEKLKALLELKTDKNEKDKDDSMGDPWAGLSYIVDTETGEYILQSSASSSGDELDDLSLEEALQLAGISDLNDNKKEQEEDKSEEEAAAAAVVTTKVPKDENSSAEDLEAILENNLKQDDFDFDLDSPYSNLLDDTEEIDLLSDMMIQPSAGHFQHPRQPSQNYAHCVNSYRQNGYHQGRVPLSRTVSMEQRWQDLANLLSFPPAMGMGVGDMSSHAAAAAAHYSPHHYPYQASGAMSQHSQFSHHHHHPHSHPAVLHNASLAEIASQPASSHHYSSNLGSAVASSMHLTNSTSETDAGNSTYKMEHDMMYYSTNPSELNHTNDGFLNSILNDEDLQLMDMAVNEGMYTMRMLDQNGTNSSAAQLNQALLGNHMQTNLSSSGIGSSASSSHQHASGDRLDASSDSAVSSMGSERVASLSDGEWNEAGSDSAQEYHSRKFIGPYDYRFNNSRMLDANRQPVAQKKHQMYGKRFAHESSVLPPPSLHPHSSIGADLTSIPNVPLKYEPYEPYAVASNNLDGAAAASSSSVIKPPASMMDSEMKYSYSIDFPHNRHLKSGGNGLASHELINHNHTYTMPHPGPLNSNGATPRPQTRDKKSKKSEDEHLTRDEKRARALHIPISVQDIINLPMDEFNERLSKYDLSENQLSLIRDIRRRGKNKVAAQNCRKRKLDQIICLADEVKDMKMRKERFLRERDLVLSERRRVKDKFAALYRHVFTNLRDSDGNPYSSYQYSLQQSADGSVVLVPRSSEQNATENATGNASGSSRNNGHHHTGPGSNSNSTNFK